MDYIPAFMRGFICVVKLLLTPYTFRDIEYLVFQALREWSRDQIMGFLALTQKVEGFDKKLEESADINMMIPHRLESKNNL